ncbi:MAG: hypothetical protein ACSLEN_14350 [Candidatus Malihini olakiniferum]
MALLSPIFLTIAWAMVSAVPDSHHQASQYTGGQHTYDDTHHALRARCQQPDSLLKAAAADHGTEKQ